MIFTVPGKVVLISRTEENWISEELEKWDIVVCDLK